MSKLILFCMLAKCDSIPLHLKIRCTYDSAKWKVVPMTKADSALMKKYFKN